ncbi:hypothetical protein Pres01_11200 [Metapseudomonas resinovorans]|nr:hypothetical protein Pres01_11200 [Pseudomonas resinovorans]
MRAPFSVANASAAKARKPRRAGISPNRQGGGGSVYSGTIHVFCKDSVMKRLHAPFVALLAAVCLLAGCGQKGPLYMPDDEKAAKEHQKDVYIR